MDVTPDILIDIVCANAVELILSRPAANCIIQRTVFLRRDEQMQAINVLFVQIFQPGYHVTWRITFVESINDYRDAAQLMQNGFERGGQLLDGSTRIVTPALFIHLLNLFSSFLRPRTKLEE